MMEQQKENAHEDDKPVGYGSSIQSSGHGNRTRPPQPVAKNLELSDDVQQQKKDKQKDV